jgi:FkbM family methyltransferase
MLLPLCRHRRAADVAGWHDCASPVLRLGAPVPASICAGCRYPDLSDFRSEQETIRAHCLSRGKLLGQSVKESAGERIELDVHACGRHGKCTVSRSLPGTACCAVCPDYRARDRSPAAAEDPANSVAAMVHALRGPRRIWPEGWAAWATTIEAHRRLADEYVAALPSYPEGKYRDRGIVILGGGVFFPGVYVTVRMIRHFGCKLPIEVWHDAAAEPIFPHWLEPFGARCIDINAHMNEHGPPRIRGGWANKFYALLHSSFEEVFYLDSDCYPVTDLTPLFELNTHGALFWQDIPGGDHHHGFIYSDHGYVPPIQGGQFLMDKRRSWRGLLLAQWWNERADFSYHHGFGDQDVLRGAWRSLQLPYRMCAGPCQFDQVGLVVFGPDGFTPALAHRTVDKFRLPFLSMKDSSATEPFLHHHYLADKGPRFHARYPGETIAFQYFREFLARLSDRPPWYRPLSGDLEIHREVVVDNAYRLPEELPANAIVIDIGAHIGTFSWLALVRGAGRAWAFEPDPDNHLLCCKNLSLFGRRATVRRQAAWSHAGKLGFSPHTLNTGMGTVHPDGNDVESLSLDEILWEATQQGRREIEYLKLDCELAEWPILHHARRLRLCRHIVGEYHRAAWQGRPCGPEQLCELLAAHGFVCATSPYSPNHGLFWASRRP